MNDMSNLNEFRWTGRPMVESCDTTDFFEKDKVYRETSKPQLNPELRQQFWCMGIFVHPSTNVLYAYGVARTASNRPWNPYPVNLVIPTWQQGWEAIQLPEDPA